MTPEPSEREEAPERLKQIRERRKSHYINNSNINFLERQRTVGEDIDFLLSLYDAQASLIEDFRHNRIGDELQEARAAAFKEAAAYIRGQWLAAYPVEVFPPPPPPPAEASRDSISAAMGRHMATKLIEHFEAAANSLLEGKKEQ